MIAFYVVFVFQLQTISIPAGNSSLQSSADYELLYKLTKYLVF